MRSGHSVSHKRFDLSSSAVYLLLHLGCLLVFFVDLTAGAVTICIISYIVRIFAISAGYHRYFAHRSFKTSRVFQFCLGVLGTLSLQRGPLWWAATHRKHHLHADTPEDLHSPAYQGFFYSHSLWFLDRRNVGTDRLAVKDLATFPELRLLDDKRVYLSIVMLYGISLFAWQGLTGLAWGFFVSTVLTHHATHWVQSMSHSFGGYRRFDTRDESRNHWLLAVLSMGEFHNNHHHSPGSARQGAIWWEIDLAYYILRVFERLGLVWSVKEAAVTSRTKHEWIKPQSTAR
jgi:stearoyl-CoA desaturase (delta-9 desaturase)